MPEESTRPFQDPSFPIFDADNHFYEPADALTRHLPAELHGAIRYVEIDGRTKLAIRNKITDYIPNPTFERVGRPGAQEEYFKSGNPEGQSTREIIGKGIDCPDAFRFPEPRLALMDELGLDYAMIMPTLASLIEERLRDAPSVAADIIHSLNRWIHDEWSFEYEGRIFPVPVLTPGIVDRALAEVEWLANLGARAVLMRPAPAWGSNGPRSFGLPEFDPLWRLIEETGLLVVIHASDSGYTRYMNEWEGSTGEMVAFGKPKPFSYAIGKQHREIQDAVTSLIAHGTLTRHPKLKIALIENGAAWVLPLLDHLEYIYSLIPQEFECNPTDIFRRNFWLHPFHEEDPSEIISRLGSSRIVFGSDYPHVEGLAKPLSYLERLSDQPFDDIKRIMGQNMIELLDV